MRAPKARFCANWLTAAWSVCCIGWSQCFASRSQGKTVAEIGHDMENGNSLHLVRNYYSFLLQICCSFTNNDTCISESKCFHFSGFCFHIFDHLIETWFHLSNVVSRGLIENCPHMCNWCHFGEIRSETATTSRMEYDLMTRWTLSLLVQNWQLVIIWRGLLLGFLPKQIWIHKQPCWIRSE